MKRKIIVPIALCLSVLTVLTITIGALPKEQSIQAVLAENRKVLYNGEEQCLYDVRGEKVVPIAYDGSTYLPLRAICDLLGAEVAWDGDTDTVYIRANEAKDSVYMQLAETYATQQIPVVEQQQREWKQIQTGTTEDELHFLSARVDTLRYATTYQNYMLFYYQSSYLPNDPNLALEIDTWTIDNTGWLQTGIRYLVFANEDSPKLVGELLSEFTPEGNAEQLYTDLDAWLNLAGL